MDNDNVVRTLWHGATFTIYEELSIRSFLKCGHKLEREIDARLEARKQEVTLTCRDRGTAGYSSAGGSELACSLTL
jgi:hypothetical protein